MPLVTVFFVIRAAATRRRECRPPSPSIRAAASAADVVIIVLQALARSYSRVLSRRVQRATRNEQSGSRNRERRRAYCWRARNDDDNNADCESREVSERAKRVDCARARTSERLWRRLAAGGDGSNGSSCDRVSFAR